MPETLQMKLFSDFNARASQASIGTPQIFLAAFALQMQTRGITQSPLNSARELLELDDLAAQQALDLLHESM